MLGKLFVDVPHTDKICLCALFVLVAFNVVTSAELFVFVLVLCSSANITGDLGIVDLAMVGERIGKKKALAGGI